MKTLICLLFLIPALCFGQIPEPMPNTYVNDLTGLLTVEQIKALNERIFSIEKKSSVQIAVVIVNKLPENMEIDQYTLEIGRKWHVGNAHNGLVYVAAIDQRKQRLEVADNLQGDIPDMIAYQITNDIKPFFKNQDYYGGINELLNGISKRVDPVVKEQLRLAGIEQKKIDAKNEEMMLSIFFWAIGVISAFLVVRFGILRSYFKKKRQEREAKEELEAKRMNMPFSTTSYPTMMAGGIAALGAISAAQSQRKRNIHEPPPPKRIYEPPPLEYIPDQPVRRSSSSSSSDNSSNYGNWGSSSSDDSSSSSGFSGGGASNDW